MSETNLATPYVYVCVVIAIGDDILFRYTDMFLVGNYRGPY